MSTTRTEYKIRRRTDGMFSTGGSYPSWNAKGKVWLKLAYLRSHLSNSLYHVHYQGGDNKYGNTPLEDIEVVTFDVSIMEVGIEDMVDAIQAARERAARRR